MKKLFAAISILLTTSTGVYALNQEFTKNMKQVEVLLQDDAKNACWTNLTESREYAEEKLRGLGATLYKGEDKYYGQYYALIIYVQSQRSSAGKCFGAVEISLETGTEINNSFHHAVHRSTLWAFTGYEKVNAGVIEQIQFFFKTEN